MMLHNKSVQEKWELRSTVRSRPRIVFDKEASGYFYPVSRQPLVVHPQILEKDEKAIEYLLIQSLYKYSNDIATIETRVVNHAILNAVTNQLPIPFTQEQKLDLYTIMVDESYHAYVAYDAMLQIEEHTGVKALALPETIEIEFAIAEIKRNLQEKYHAVFELVCVCLAENTLTKEIISMTDKAETHPFFQRIIKDHLTDESRHSGVFYKLLKYIWSNLSEEYKEAIGKILPDFIELYLDIKVQIKFDKQVLIKLGFSDIQSQQILDETYGGFKLNKQHPMLKNILMLLDKTEILDNFTLPQFKAKDWV